MATKKLEQIAGDMRQMLEANEKMHFVHQRLARGLELVLERRGEQQWRLALGRQDVEPSVDEIEICREAFRVPAAAEPNAVTKQRKSPKTNLPVVYHVTELTWREG